MKKSAFYLLLTGCIVTGTGCNNRKEPEQHLLTVKTEMVKPNGQEFIITYPGKTTASSDLNLSFRIAGPIKRIPVEPGQFVHKGDLLAEMDPRDYQIQLNATEAEYAKIKAEAERVIELYKRGSATANDYDKAQYGLQQITQKLEAHRNALKDTRLTAPVTGYVQKKFFQANETVGAGMPVISMIGKEGTEIIIHIPLSDYIRREQFEEFSANSDAYPDRQFPLELVGIARKANLNQLYEVRLRFRNQQDLPMTPGMSMNVTISFVSSESSLASLPLSAVFQKEGKSAVWVLNPDTRTVQLRTVNLIQIKKDGSVVVDAGIRPGEIVVSAGVNSLHEGMEVRILPAVSKTNIGGLL